MLEALQDHLRGLGWAGDHVDPARFGDDAFAIVNRTGRKVSKIERRYRLNTVEGANWVKAIIDLLLPRAVFIDVGNMGAGVIDILRDFGEPYSDLVIGVETLAARRRIRRKPPSAAN